MISREKNFQFRYSDFKQLSHEFLKCPEILECYYRLIK